MSKSKQKIKALELREKGESIKQIAQKLGVSKSTVSLWCRDIILTPLQIKKLHERMVSLSYTGRMKGARLQYENRLKRVEESNVNGQKTVGKLSERELLLVFVALYWAEGAKKSGQFTINNSDPDMIKFIVYVLRKVWKISEDRLTAYVGINVIHKKRDKEVKKYWEKTSGISQNQFRKTVFIKAKNKKVYKNFLTHYGTLNIVVKKPMDVYYPMLGLIQGLTKGI